MPARNLYLRLACRPGPVFSPESQMYLEIAIVLLLTLVNGGLAMSELAIVSARTARLKVMADRGSHGARVAMALAEHPGRFLSSVQIGITLVGVLSGAFSGATLGARLSGALLEAGFSRAVAHPLGMGSVVVAITYLSLIVGELVPKQIALRAPEAVAVRVAPIMRWIARLTAPLVWLLDISGKLVLRLLGQSGVSDSTMSDEEVKLVISEAQSAGVMEKAETEMIAGVMRSCSPAVTTSEPTTASSLSRAPPPSFCTSSSLVPSAAMRQMTCAPSSAT